MKDFNTKSVLYIISALLFAAICAIFAYQVYATSDSLFFAPAGIGFVGFAVFIFLFIKETFIGKHEYKIVNGMLIVERRGRTLCVAHRNDIHSVVLVYSSGEFSDELHYLCFSVGNQRYYANVLNGENKKIVKFFDGMEHKISRNVFFSIIEPFAS